MAANYADIIEDNVFTVLRSFILGLVDCEVIRTPINRNAMPKHDFISMTPIHTMALETNTRVYGATEETILKPTQFTIQVDAYGARAGDRMQVITTLFRDFYACDLFKDSGYDLQPLYASDPQQMPIVTGEEQFLKRWTSLFEIQMNPIITINQPTANVVNAGLINVDRVYPPGA